MERELWRQRGVDVFDVPLEDYLAEARVAGRGGGQVTIPPYKGLRPFEDSPDDVEFFFGRERDREIISANLMASRLTVLYGESGAGKSSVLRAGVAHNLRATARESTEERGRPELAVAVFDAWSDDPMPGLVDAVAEAVRTARGDSTLTAPELGSLADRLHAWSELLDGDLYVILDGVEEYFLYHEAEDGPGTFAAEFPEAVEGLAFVRASSSPCARTPWQSSTGSSRPFPNLFGNYLRLEHLDRDAGRRAIAGPLERHNELEPDQAVAIEPELIEAVLDEVQTGRVELGQTGRGAVEVREQRSGSRPRSSSSSCGDSGTRSGHGVTDAEAGHAS